MDHGLKRKEEHRNVLGRVRAVMRIDQRHRA